MANILPIIHSLNNTKININSKKKKNCTNNYKIADLIEDNCVNNVVKCKIKL